MVAPKLVVVVLTVLSISFGLCQPTKNAIVLIDIGKRVSLCSSGIFAKVEATVPFIFLLRRTVMLLGTLIMLVVENVSPLAVFN